MAVWTRQTVALAFVGISTVASLAFVQAADVAGWPTYMHDNSRSGFTAQEIAVPLSEVWVYQALHPPQPAWPPPARQDFWHNKSDLKALVTYDRAMHVVSDGSRVFFGSSADDQVRCLDLATGRLQWSFLAEGPVRLAPTLHHDRVLFGSDDGFVYCLNATDGSLVWRYRVTESDRWLPGNGRIISGWPVRSGVIVDDRKAHFAAGLFPGQGTCQIVVDADSGEQLARGNLAFSPQGYMTQQGGNLMISTGRTPETVLERLKATEGANVVSLGENPPDYPLALIGAGRLRFAGGDGRVAVVQADNGRVVQQLKVRGKAYSLAVVGGALLVSTDEGLIHCFRPATAAEDSRVVDVEKIPSEPRRTPDEFWPPEQIDVCAQVANRAIAETGYDRGYCLVYGSEEGCLAYELAKRTQTKVIGIESNPGKAARSRRILDSLGVYGRVTVHCGPLDSTPYASAIFNLVVSETALTSGAVPGRAAEVTRLVRPHGGTVVLGRPPTTHDATAISASDLKRWANGKSSWQVIEQDGVWAKYVRPPLVGAGRWTHLFANPGNSACSDDTIVGGPFLLQWFGEPGPREMVDRHHRTVSPLCADGRLYIPGDDQVFAVDAYNGTPLWSHKIPGFRRIAAMRDTGNMAVADNRLYLVAGRRCHVFDGQSGDSIATYEPPIGVDGSARDWGYVAVVGERLFGSGTRPDASRTGHSREAIDGAYYDARPMVTSTSVFCGMCESGENSWTYRAAGGAILNPTICIGGGRIYFVESSNPATLAEKTGRSTLATLLAGGSRLVALDATSGREIWRQDTDFKAIEHSLYLCYADERLVAVGSRNQRAESDSKTNVWYDIHTFGAADGIPLWQQSQDNRQRAGGSHGEQDHHPVIVGDTVYVQPLAYDLASGRRNESWELARGGHGCGTLSACPSGLFFRAGNPCMFDLASKRKTQLTRVTRPGCWINIIPAGGLVLIPEASSGCTCKFSIQTSLALVPAAWETMIPEEKDGDQH